MDEINSQLGNSLSHSKTLASIVANTYTYAVGCGIDASSIHTLTGLLRIELLDPEARLPEAIVPLIWTLLCKAHPEQRLTLHMASGTPLSYFDSLAQCLQYADTLRSALQTFVRYGPVLSDRLCLDWVESSTEGVLRLHHPVD
ncbi:MAG: AraC family transcriptional regulator ligand-binding domain-containing protein, partial [Cyanobacteria bacterium P01_H01_bin.58]